MRRALWVSLAVLLGLAVPAHSAPIVVSAGDVLTFNFDFEASGVVPEPPYPFVQFDTGLGFGTLGPGDFGLWTGFSDLNGTGSTIFGPFSAALIATVLSEGDGVFSMVLSVVTGSFTVDPVAYGYNNQVLLTEAVAPVSVVAAVPEPTTLTLLGLGLAAAAHRRRRRSL